MVANHDGAERTYSTDIDILDKLHYELQEIQISIYHRRLKHLKHLQERVEMMHKMVDRNYHDAYQVFEYDLHNIASKVRRLQKELEHYRASPS